MEVWSLHLALINLKNENFLPQLKNHLQKVFPKLQSISISRINGKILKDAFSPRRNQYHSTRLLFKLLTELSGVESHRILAITDVDLYVQGLNFVFGEAQCPGKYAIISLYRLKPEIYGQTDGELFLSRVRKEAVHELGHTFGLTHCPNPSCVMHFSNSILDTDRKADDFCQVCRRKLNRALEESL